MNAGYLEQECCLMELCTNPKGGVLLRDYLSNQRTFCGFSYHAVSTLDGLCDHLNELWAVKNQMNCEMYLLVI